MSQPSTSSLPSQPETIPPPWWHWRRVSLGYKRRAQQRMKAVAEHALNALDATLELAGDAAGDAGVPGLAGALSAARVVVQKIQQTMKTNVEGVDSLDAHIVSLRDIFADFVERREGHPISEDTLKQIAELGKAWGEIAQQAGNIKSRGRIRRFFSSNADAKKLAGLVEQISSSINEKFLVHNILMVKEEVHGLRRDVEVVREDVVVIREDTEIVREDVGAVRDDAEVIRNDVEIIRKDAEVIREDAKVVRQDVEVVRGDVEIVREDMEVVREDAEVIRADVDVVRQDVEVVREDVGVIRQDVDVVRGGIGVVLEDVGIVREDTAVVREDVGVIRQDVDVIREDVDRVRRNVEVMLDGSFMATYAKKAQYDAGGAARRPCLEGTRVAVLQRLYAWIKAACTRTAAILDTGSVFWINGLAGTGKTTIAFSVAEWSDKQGLLAANFFCSHSDAECSDPNLIFPTLSRQLCGFHAPFREKAAAVLRARPDLIHAGPLRQFEELIVKPLEAVKDTFPTSVVVLDALDECADKEATSIILTAIAQFIHRITGLVLFVVTSRPEDRITTMFDQAAADTLKDVTTPLLLHKIDLESVLNDIRRFLEDGFARRPRFLTVKEGWPAQQDVNRLVEMSGGLFIWAATVLRFIMDLSFRDPEGQMQSVLTAGPTSSVEENMLGFLYNQIATAASSKVSTTLSNRLRPILGAIALAPEPVSVGTLAGLVELSEAAVRNTLVGLGSVLHIPDADHPTEPIQIIHLTFPEFLLSSSPAKPEAFCISAADHHLVLFMRCMAVMRDLKRNIAGIESPCAFKSEIPDLAKKVKACISPLLGYAVRYWTNHLINCVGSMLVDGSFDAFREFLYGHYLHWLEACSLLGIIDSAVTAHYAVVQACQTLRGRFASLLPLLVDCRRFALTYAACVDAAPLQLYHSALSLAPTRSLVRAAYEKDLSASLLVCRGARSEWAPCVDAFKGHGDGEVYAVAFSPSGDCFITGGGDKKLRMWRPSTRTLILSFDGHTGAVNCAAFSPDGVYVASGSDNRDVRIWLVSSGQCVQTLKGHADGVDSVAYSADGRRLLSATAKGEVKLWDVSDGRCVLTLDTGDSTEQAGLSADGTVIAYGHGASLTLYDTSSATDETIDFPKEVSAATFSPDGRYIAARSGHDIRVWKVADRSLVRSIDVPDDDLYGQLVFSRDGTHIACGSWHGPVYLWHVASEIPPRVLRGHTSWVQNLSWSPDGLQVVSVSDDGTVRVWDVTQSSTDAADIMSQRRSPVTGPVRFILTRHEGETLPLPLPSCTIDTAHFAALASALPDGAPALTPFADMADAWDTALQFSNDMSDIARACPWAAVAGQQHVYSSASLVSISPDGSLMAYRSSTLHRVVDICNIHTANVVASLTGHTRDVVSVAFSPDSTLVATGSYDRSVKVWSPTTGAMLHMHDTHRDWFHALAFSPDGRLIASGSDDHSVHVFEIATGRVVRVFKSHRNLRVLEVAFVSTNAHVMSLDRGNSLYIWDMATGTNVYDISLTDDSWIHGLNFSPDGTGILISHPEARTLSLWDAASRACPVYMVSKEGWLYAKSPGCTARSGWLPPEWRNPFPLGDGKLCAPDFSQKRAVVFDVSRLPEYVLM